MPSKGTKYDFSMMILFRNILVSPEQIKEREFIKEREIKDGYKKVIDANGKVVLDEKGKEVLGDNFKKVTVQIYEYRQLKTCQVTAKVEFVSNKGNQLLQSYPVTSEFVLKTFMLLTKATEELLKKAIILILTEELFHFLLQSKWYMIQERI